MRIALTSCLTLLLLGGTAAAQGTATPQPAQAPATQTPGTAPPTEKTDPSSGSRGETQQLKEDPAVQQSQLPPPTPQGTRPPDVGLTDTENPPLNQALEAIWRSPPDLQGNPVSRPNVQSDQLPADGTAPAAKP